MSYKPNYDEVTKGYNDALNILSGGNFTPVKRKREAEQTSIFDKPAGNGYNGGVGSTYKPTYGNTQAEKRYSPSYEYKPSYGNAQTMPSFEKGWGTTQSGERMLWEPTYGKTNSSSALWNNQTVNNYTPQQRNEFEISRISQTQTPSYRPGEGFITKPENAILRADERKNIKLEQLPYKPDEHSGEYEQYSNRTTGFGELKLASNDVGTRAGNVRWDYYDMHLPEAEQDLLESYFQEYERTPDNAIITLPEGIEVNKKLYINEQIMAIRRNLIPSQMLLFAQKDFEMLDIDERNYKIVLGYDDYVTYDQALYEYAIDLYNSYQENGAYPYSTRNFDGSLNEYGKWLYNYAGKVSKRSGKEKASDAPSWVRWYTQQQGESAHDFATRILNDKFGAGNWKKGPGSDYNKIIKYIHRR